MSKQNILNIHACIQVFIQQIIYKLYSAYIIINTLTNILLRKTSMQFYLQKEKTQGIELLH